MAMEEGVIAELGERGSGFIRRSRDKEQLFFHSDSVVNSSFAELRTGDSVKFDMTESKKGPYATRVEKI